MANKLKTGDEVIVIAGKDVGSRGKITKIVKGKMKGKTQQIRVYVEGVNMVKKAQRPNPQLQQPGGIIEQEAPLDISNVAIYNPVTDKADRVGFKLMDENRYVRIFKSNQEQIEL